MSKAISSAEAQEKRWQAENDARTLMEAKVIQKTPGRLTAAAKVAKDMAKKASVEAAAMQSIAKTAKKAPQKVSQRGSKTSKKK